MANEITITPRLGVKKGLLSRDFGVPAGIKADMAGDTLYSVIRSIGTSEVPLTSFDGITTPGVCYLRNLDDTNFVEFGPTAGDYFKLLAGEAAMFRFSGTSLFLKANTAVCNVEIVVVES